MNKLEFNNIPEKDRMNRVLEGTAFYASVHKPNLSAAKKFGSAPAFMLNLGLDDNGVKQAKLFGLKIHPADAIINMPYVKIQRKIKDGKTEEDTRPDVVDTEQKPLPKTMLIGNGSKVAVKFGTYWYDTQGGGVGTVLFKVLVRALVPFTPSTKDKDLLAYAGGFTVADENSESNLEEFDA